MTLQQAQIDASPGAEPITDPELQILRVFDSEGLMRSDFQKASTERGRLETLRIGGVLIDAEERFGRNRWVFLSVKQLKIRRLIEPMGHADEYGPYFELTERGRAIVLFNRRRRIREKNIWRAAPAGC